MNKDLQAISNLIQQSAQLSDEEKKEIVKSLKNADKELEITTFKLDRTEKVKKTTAILLEETIEELEQKRKAVEAQNKELEIETSLERVRTVAMGMRKADDLLDVCQALFAELRTLGFDELRNAMINIFNNDSISFLNYDYSHNAGKTITSHYYNSHPVIEKQVNEVKSSGDAFSETVFSGKDLEEWRKFRKEKGEKDDPKLDTITALFYYFYAIGTGAIGISTYSSIPDEKLNVLKRFRNVFDLAYRRFIDIEKAEAQAREAQIQLGLERVRAKAMAMQNSDELKELIGTVFTELTKLDLVLTRCVIIIYDAKTLGATWWMANSEDSSNPTGLFVNHAQYPAQLAYIKAWQERELKWQYVLEGKIKKEWDDFLFVETELSLLPDFVIAGMKAPDRVYLNASFNNFGNLTLASLETLSNEHFDILLRFAKVFDLTYTRFNDLQKAEEQARESQIQLSLERVRARTMAMQKQNDLLGVLDLLVEQLVKLGVNLQVANFSNGIPGGDWDLWIEVAADDGTIFNNYVHFPRIEHPYFHHVEKNIETYRKDGTNLFKDVFSKEEKDSWQDYINTQTIYKDLTPEDIRQSMYEKPGYVWSMVILKDSCVSICRFNTIPFSDEEDALLRRFANAFGQTYTRFLDLQKAEAQARESQIQLALERVRARTMAMQKSDELPDAANLLFQQMQALGMPAWSAGYCIWDANKQGITLWMSSEGVMQPSFHTPLTEDPSFIHFREAYERGESFHVEAVGGDELVSHYKYMRTLPGIGEVLDSIINAGHPLPTFQIFHCAYFSQGFLLFITYEPIPEAHDIFKRFAKVFEQTYTRFLDLQKAEAQAKEAIIEASLERIRSSAMAMHSSDDVVNATGVVFRELHKLGIETMRCGILIIDEDQTMEVWSVTDTEDGKTVRGSGRFDMKVHPLWKGLYDAWKQKEDHFYYHLAGEDKNAYYRILTNSPKYFSGTLHEFPDQDVEAYNFRDGALWTFSLRPHSEADKQVLKRFTAVFSLTLRRYQDLKKAEEQAKESQIEAALERVRSRSMGMQKSEELSEVIQIVFNQLVHLNVPAEHTGFVMDYKTRDDYNLWIADRFGSPSHVTIPYFDSIYYNTFNEAKENGVDFFVTTLSFEEKNKFYEELFNHVPGLPEESKEIIFNAPGYSISTALLENVSLYIENFTGIPFSDEENAILIRFGKVFQQTYTRFLDLQRAEAQALEAIKRASVDRVRAEIASMRTTSDLERITPLIWNELTTLGVPFIRCGVFIMDVEKQEVQTFLYTEGKAIASFTSTFSNSNLIIEAVPYWRRKEIYKTHWDEAAFLEQARNLVEQGSITSGEKYLTEYRPTDLYLHFLPFLQGMLYVGDAASLSNEHLQLVQALAEAFSTAYARYEDFNKLESAKKQVDSTLTELQATQKQLIQSEKMASLGELTAGIAHEIQNPLNFVNNFSEVSKELIEELESERSKVKSERDETMEVEILNDIKQNLEKINHHGKRADAIVKGMLQHSRSTGNEKQPTDINVLADEYLRLAYHGLRAKDKSFNATMKTDYDETIGKINIIPQDIGRVILNVITNAFYTVNEKKKVQGNSYEPTVSIITKKDGDSVEIKVVDNGNGIPQKIVDKIFQPFFTTKPTGQGTGLGLSLAYDIVKAHGGELKVETREGKGSLFIIQLSIV